jgi:hypothetical protein
MVHIPYRAGDPGQDDCPSLGSVTFADRNSLHLRP